MILIMIQEVEPNNIPEWLSTIALFLGSGGIVWTIWSKFGEAIKGWGAKSLSGKTGNEDPDPPNRTGNEDPPPPGDTGNEDPPPPGPDKK